MCIQFLKKKNHFLNKFLNICSETQVINTRYLTISIFTVIKNCILKIKMLNNAVFFFRFFKATIDTNNNIKT